MLDNTWDYGVEHTKHTRYQPVVECTYWPVLGSFNKRNIVKITKKTSSEDFDELHKVFIDDISDDIASLGQLGKYGAINTADPTTLGYYVITYLSEQ